MQKAASWGDYSPARKVDIVKELYVADNSSAAELSERIRKKYGIQVSRNGIIGLYGRHPDLRESHPLTGSNQKPNLPGPKSARSEYARQVAEQARATRIRIAAERRRASEERKAAAEKKLVENGKAATIAERKREAEEFNRESAYNVSLLELRDGLCKWPTNDSTASMTFCGRDDLSTKGPYCHFHRRLAYEPRKS